ncbi:MAG: hypothetical protein GY719_26145 [bacterium]|nr:hypothetical protein [bacterium]
MREYHCRLVVYCDCEPCVGRSCGWDHFTGQSSGECTRIATAAGWRQTSDGEGAKDICPSCVRALQVQKLGTPAPKAQIVDTVAALKRAVACPARRRECEAREEAMARHGEDAPLRAGQVLWNAAEDLAPELVEDMRGGELDPFSFDDRIEPFLRELLRRVAARSAVADFVAELDIAEEG